MKNKLILLYVFFANSSFCKSMASFSEFSELFLSQEINELDGIEFDKDVFEKSRKMLENEFKLLEIIEIKKWAKGHKAYYIE